MSDVISFADAKLRQGDHMVRGTAADGMIRAIALTARQTVQTAHANHNTSPLVSAALGRLMMGGLMMGALFKSPDELITLEVRGDGPIGGLTVTANNQGQVKGFANHPNVWLPLNEKGKLDVGSGLGQGTPDKIPFATTDFIFASCCEEYGLIIGVCIILISLNCFFVMLKLSMGFADKFYQLFAYGIAVAYGFQAFLTVGGQTKFIPLTGVTLPLISYGGSSILTTMIMFTLVEIMYILRSEKIDEVRRQQHMRQQVAYRSAPPGPQTGYRYPQNRYQNPGNARNYSNSSRRYQ